MTIGVVIPAAGVGARLNTSPPKQFVKIDGLPLLFYTIDAFTKFNCDVVIIVVCPKDYLDFVKSEVLSYLTEHVNKGSIILAMGSYSRHRSIAVAMDLFQQIPSIIFPPTNKPDLVIVQDGVRPLVDYQLLSRLIEAAQIYGASGPVCDLVSTTLKVNEEGFVDGALDRKLYKQSEMPQVFKYDIIRKAYAQATDHELDHGTECLDLVTKYTDARVKFAEGSSGQLFKVTFKKDLYAVEGILKELRTVKLIPMSSTMDDDFLLIKEIERELKKRFKKVLIETFRNGYNQYKPTQSLVFIYFTDFWKNIRTDQNVSSKANGKGPSRVHLILLKYELSGTDYGDIVKYYRNDMDNYIIGTVSNNLIKLFRLLSNILWNCDHTNGQIHFL